MRASHRQAFQLGGGPAVFGGWIAAALIVASSVGGCAARPGTERSPASAGVTAAQPAPPAAASPAPAIQRFEDRAGDGGSGADIRSVSVFRPNATDITFSIEFAAAPPLAVDEALGYTDMLMIGIDTGEHPDESAPPASATDFAGVDFLVGAHGADLSMAPSLWSRRLGVVGPYPGQPPLGTARVDGRTLALSLPADLIEAPLEMELKVMVGREWVASPPAGEAGAEQGDVWPDVGSQHVVLVR